MTFRLRLHYSIGANTQMTRRCGRSPIGQPPVCVVPHGHQQTTTRIAVVRRKGLGAQRKVVTREPKFLPKVNSGWTTVLR